MVKRIIKEVKRVKRVEMVEMVEMTKMVKMVNMIENGQNDQHGQNDQIGQKYDTIRNDKSHTTSFYPFKLISKARQLVTKMRHFWRFSSTV